MAQLAVWHGSEADIMRLIQAVEHNCTCARGGGGERRSCCSAHAMLAFDQRALDGLLFMRSLADRLENEEWERSFETLRVTPAPAPLPQQKQELSLTAPAGSLRPAPRAPTGTYRIR